MQGNVSSSIQTGHKNNPIDKLRYYCDLILIILPKENIGTLHHYTTDLTPKLIAVYLSHFYKLYKGF